MNEINNVIPLKFTFESKDVRTYVDAFSHRWYCMRDVFKALGYANPNMSASNIELDPEGVCELCTVVDSTTKGKRTAKFINEPNLYEFIFSSRMPAAKRFKKWLKETVIPSLRATGKYERPEGKKFNNVVDFVNSVDSKPKITAQSAENKALISAPSDETLKRLADALDNSTRAVNFLLRRMVDTDKAKEDPKPHPTVTKILKSTEDLWKRESLNVSEVGKLINRTGSEVNNLLEHMKYIDRRGDRLSITLTGRDYGDYYQFKTKHGDYGRYIRWKPAIVKVLQDYLDQQRTLN